MEDLLGTIVHDDYISDYWIFEEDYIKEVKYIGDTTSTHIYEIEDFLTEHPNHPIIQKLNEFRET
jgi:hypothetical protein